jgi:hypothetical protein
MDDHALARLEFLHVEFYDSSEKIVGDLGLGQLAK